MASSDSHSVNPPTFPLHGAITSMARKKAAKKKKATRKKATRRKKGAADFIISKARTKAASGINVSGEFYAALDGSVRSMIDQAEQRAISNGRKTLRPHDL